MHRVVTRDGGMRQSTFLWWTAALAYASFTAAGALFIISPQLGATYGTFGDTMAAFLVIGGLLSLAGSLTRRWAGEFVGTPLLAVGSAVLGLLTWKATHEQAFWLAYGNLVLLWGLALMMCVRFRMVLALYWMVHDLVGGDT